MEKADFPVYLTGLGNVQGFNTVVVRTRVDGQVNHIAFGPRGATVIGRNTHDAMLSGIYWGYIAMIEGLVARIKAEIGRPTKVISTGGLATLFDEHSSVFDQVEPDLTINGLAMMYRRWADTQQG